MRQFPILMPYKDSERAELIRLGCPTSVPWDLVAAHEQQARMNHGGQSVARLAERGGLGVSELVAVLRDQLLRAPFLAEAESVPALLELLPGDIGCVLACPEGLHWERNEVEPLVGTNPAFEWVLFVDHSGEDLGVIEPMERDWAALNLTKPTGEQLVHRGGLHDCAKALLESLSKHVERRLGGDL